MKKALILYTHGLGDVIMLTPHLRYLHQQGYMTTLMCRQEVSSSHLLDECPYISGKITVPNPWESVMGYEKQNRFNVEYLEQVAKDQKFDFAGKALHADWDYKEHKIDWTSRELGWDFFKGMTDKKLEIFPSEESVKKAEEYVESAFVNKPFIFIHSVVENHPAHTWQCNEEGCDEHNDAAMWTRFNFPDFPFFSTEEILFDDINVTFEIIRRAAHRIICSSVFVHAAEAMDLYIDCINYGKRDRKVWPLNQDKVLRIRECGEWIKK